MEFRSFGRDIQPTLHSQWNVNADTADPLIILYEYEPKDVGYIKKNE